MLSAESNCLKVTRTKDQGNVTGTRICILILFLPLLTSGRFLKLSDLNFLPYQIEEKNTCPI